MKECPQCLTCLDDAAGECPHDGAKLVTGFDGNRIIDGKYRVDRRLGRGGMGVVYLARHLGLQRNFALKLINLPHADGSVAERFRVEARALGRLKHPHIVEVTDYGVDPRGKGLPYLVMEYLEGTTLHAECQKAGALPIEGALPVFCSIARAIDYAHEQGVLHRDLKPVNILLTRANAEAQTVKILDFGLARLVQEPARQGRLAAASRAERAPDAVPPNSSLSDEADEMETLDIRSEHRASRALGASAESTNSLQEEGVIEGTPAFMAPEIIQGRAATAASDIYAFGVLIYEVVVGMLPFSGTPLQMLSGHVKVAPPPPSTLRHELPSEVNAALLAPLEKDPERRPKSAAAVVRAIQSAWLNVQRRKWREREIPRRVRLAALLALVLALLTLPLERTALVQALERRAVDMRFLSQPRSAPDPRLLVVLVDEASLAADPTPLAEKADQFGRELEKVFFAGARGVAIDFLLPSQWSRSENFSKLILKHSEQLTLAALASPSGQAIGTDCISDLTAAAMDPAQLSRLFGFVNMDEDPDGVVRRGRLWFVDQDGAKRNSWVARAAGAVAGRPGTSPAAAERFWIERSVDWNRIQTISWKDLPTKLEYDSSFFQGRLLLVGGNFAGSGDDYRLPAHSGSTETVPGVVLQALMVDTILSGLPVRELPRLFWLLGLGLGLAALLAIALCVPRFAAAATLCVGVEVFYFAAAFVFFRHARILAPVAAPLLTGFVASSLGFVLKSRLAAYPPSKLEE
jgi:serine/threonine protein kinase